VSAGSPKATAFAAFTRESHVKPRVLALDLDGTIAVNDTIDLDVTAAIEEARHAGYWPYSLPGEP